MWPSFGAGSPRTGGTRAKSVIWKETVTSRPSTSLGVGNVISTYRISIRGVPVAGPWVTVGETIVRVGPAAEASGEIERSDVRPRSTIATAAAHRHAFGGPVAGPMVPRQFGGR